MSTPSEIDPHVLLGTLATLAEELRACLPKGQAYRGLKKRVDLALAQYAALTHKRV